MRKFMQTAKIAATLMLARTFGRYIHSGWDGTCDYAKYRWRGQVWYIPTSPARD